MSCVKLSLGTIAASFNFTISSVGIVGQITNSRGKSLYNNNGCLNFDRPKTFPNFKQSMININGKKPISAVKNSSQNYNDQFAAFSYDNPGESGVPLFNMYEATANVIKTVFETLKSKQEDIIKSYEIADDIVLTVTGSISVLYFLRLNIDRLGKALY